MEEIGCHFKLEKIIGNNYHNSNLMLSSGRNCLRFIIKEREITTLFLPYFLCESLSEVALAEKIDDLINRFKYVIVDNTHDFFNKDAHSADVIYNYRKYFGVPDGACIVSNDLSYNPNYQIGKSLNKVVEIVSRDENGKFFHYPTFLEADKHFRNEELRYMSNFTSNFLNAIDYNLVLKRRIENYKLLLEMLSKYNQLELNGKELTYMYPLLVEDGEQLRTYLKENNIYAIKLWPNVLWNGANKEEIERVENMILLPIDQRYSTDEMLYISTVINTYFSKNKSKNRILR